MSSAEKEEARIERERRRFQAALQDYLAALASASSPVVETSKKQLLVAYCEFQYQVRGGTRCALCRAPVRYRMSVDVRMPDYSERSFEALCTRCLEAQRAVADTVTLRVGPAEYATYRRGDDQPEPRRTGAAA